MKNLILKRTEAAAYLSSSGLRVSKITLARMAMDGSGPPYTLIRWLHVILPSHWMIGLIKILNYAPTHWPI